MYVRNMTVLLHPTLLVLAQWGCTALLRAAYGGSVPVVRMLLKDYNSSLDEVDEVSVFSKLRCCLVCVVLLFRYQFPQEYIMNQKTEGVGEGNTRAKCLHLEYFPMLEHVTILSTTEPLPSLHRSCLLKVILWVQKHLYRCIDENPSHFVRRGCSSAKDG